MHHHDSTFALLKLLVKQNCTRDDVCFFAKQVVFDVYSTALTLAKLKLSYNAVVLNIGNGWNAKTQQFIAPQAGIYYLSYSLGLQGGEAFFATIVVNGTTNYCNNELHETTHSGLDLVSRGCLIKLAQGDTAQPTLFQYIRPDAGSSYNESTFRGFLYAPVQGVQVRMKKHSISFLGVRVYC